MSLRIGAIDVGTNSIHLLVAEISARGEVTIVEKARNQAELGSGGIDAHQIAPDAFERGVAALESFRTACDSFEVEDIHCAATSAVREAENGAEFCQVIKERTGIHVRVISGAEEARLIYLGARDALDFSQGRVMLLDIGGGSTEFILCDAESELVTESLPLGHIRLADRFRQKDPMTPSERRGLKAHVREVLRSLVDRVHPDDVDTLVGTSGAIRTLALMSTLRRGDVLPPHEHGLVLHREELEELIGLFLRTSEAELAELPGMDMRRKRTLPVAAIVVREVMRSFGKSQLLTSERSLRDGLVIDWMMQHRPEVSLSDSVRDPRRRSVMALMERYGADRGHALAITSFALALFDATASLHRLRVQDRRLLEYAALLHDIGHHISGRDHNRHGEYLIRHTRMGGFTAPEIGILALTVRYHRGGKPKDRHHAFHSLSLRDKHRVRVMAAILRLADGFDRGRQQNVHTLTVNTADDVVTIRALTHTAPDLEQWAAVQRRKILSKILGRPIEIDIERAPPPS